MWEEWNFKTPELDSKEGVNSSLTPPGIHKKKKKKNKNKNKKIKKGRQQVKKKKKKIVWRK